MDLTALIRSLPGPVFAGAVVILFGMAGVALAAAISARRRAALIDATPTSPIAFAENGYRAFEGAVEAPGGLTLTAPLTGAACCWFSVIVERAVPSKQSTSPWRTVRELTSTTPFLVRDSTGACAIYPFGAEVVPTDQALWTGATEVPTDRSPARVPGGASTSSTIEIAGTADTQFRYKEQAIYPGDPVLVLGAFQNGRLATQDDDEDEGDDAEDESEADPDDAPENGDGGPAWAHANRFDEGQRAADAVTRAWTARDASRPFIISTTPRQIHVTMTATGSQAAFTVAAVPIAVAALLLWVRFG